MAINPMQRKARNSFLLGMLVMMLIAAVVIAFLFMQIMQMKQKEQVVADNSRDVYMLTRDVKSGEPLDASAVKKVTIETNITQDNIANISDLTEETVAKIDLPKGAFLSTSMLANSDEKTSDDLRVQEYNMILLPTNLSKEDYVDVRIRFANGQDYIILAKKRVLTSTQNTVFFKMTEAEILTMSNAIVESYMADGSIIYADKYESAGIQKAATPTYNVSRSVLGLINDNPNIVETARNALWSRYKTERRAEVDGILSGVEEPVDKVQAGNDQQIQKQQTERTRYIETLGVGADY